MNTAERILIVSATDKGCAQLSQLISKLQARVQIATAKEAVTARRAISEGDYSLVIVNTPLASEFGQEIASFAAQTTPASVILLVKEEACDAIAHQVESDGVAIVSKPLNRELFYQTMHLLQITQKRMAVLQNENKKLRKKLDEERVVARAKCILIECMAMTEPEAHAYLEKRAMNERITRYEVAVDVLQTNG